MKIFPAFVLLFISSFSFGQDGTIDLTFGTSNGVVQAELFQDIRPEGQVVVQTDGKILQLASGGGQCMVYRYKADGSGLDSTFGVLGKFTAPSPLTTGHDMILQPDGKILVCGKTRIDAGADAPLVMRLKQDGSIDAAFGTSGQTIVPFTGSSSNTGTGMALQPDGKIVVASSVNYFGTTGDLGLFRLTTNGQLDNSFGTGGKITDTEVRILSQDQVAGIGIQCDGKIVVAGNRDLPGEIRVKRYMSNGTPDPNFGTGGYFTSSATTGIYRGDMAFQPDGKILICGTTSGTYGDMAILRMSADGIIDNSFGTNGYVTTEFLPSYLDWCYTMLVQNDGRIIISGDISNATGAYKMGIARFTANGVPDPGFGTAGKLIISPGNLQSLGGMLAFQGNKIILAGRFNTGGGNTNMKPGVVRLNNTSSYYVPAFSAPTPAISISGSVLTSSSASGNQWYLNGNPVPGATGQTYNAVTAGSYTVAITSNGCSGSMSSPIVYSITSVDQPLPDFLFKLYPNPVTDKLLVDCPGNNKMNVEILNSTGQRVFYSEGFIAPSAIDMSKLERGVYLVRIVNNKTKQEFRKMIVK